MYLEEINKILKLIPLLSNNEIDDSLTLRQLCDKINNFEQDILLNLLMGAEWPVAINPDLICDPNSDSDKLTRAAWIIEGIHIDFKNAAFLDLGCGEGHIAEKALEYGARISYGYDIKPQGWEFRTKKDNLIFTDSFDNVGSKFDIIFIYDVLDHSTDPVGVLKQAKNVLNNNGQIYVMCHPWCSKHGGHLYHKLNKAYIHLVFNNDELIKMGMDPIYTRKSIHPLGDYYHYFEQAGLKRVFEDIKREEVSGFFSHPVIANRIKANWSSSPDESLRSGRKLPSFQMEQQLCEFVLRR